MVMPQNDNIGLSWVILIVRSVTCLLFLITKKVSFLVGDKIANAIALMTCRGDFIGLEIFVVCL
jgi:hypothetical protein